jgi:hypothetical protein
MQAFALRPGALGARADRPGIDPMLVWADATGLALLRRPGQDMPQAWPLVVDDPHPNLPSCRGTAWTTARLQQWLAQPEARPHRLRLALPVLPLRPLPQQPRPASAQKQAWPASAGEVLLGVIDHGCPFAHALLRRHVTAATGAPGTRVLALWDQDDSTAGLSWPGAAAPREPGYGTLLTREQLDDVMARHTVHGLGIVDEARCYETLGYDALRHSFTHGAAVLGALVDLPPPGARVAPDTAGAAQQADVVFVQIPRDSVQDCSSAALERYVLDGLDAIIACRGQATRRIVVTVSDGTSRTTHDGRSLVERGIAERAEALRKQDVTLDVVVAVGNSRDELRHAQFDPLAAGGQASVVLEVQPDDEAASFVTLRLPAGGTGVSVWLTAPDGSRALARMGQAVGLGPEQLEVAPSRAAATLVLAVPATGAASDEAALGLVCIQPTRPLGPHAVAPAGRWQIGVQADAATTEPIHLWISRSQTNATALPRGRQARFVDEDGQYDPPRASLPLEADPGLPRSPIRRLGSINGLATLPDNQGMRVIGAAFDREGVVTLHSAAGPSAGRGEQVRTGPDFLMPVDFSRTDPGMNVPGTRSGARLRVSGSSFAAPQAAALLADGQSVPEPVAPQRRGRRALPADPVSGAGLLRRR